MNQREAAEQSGFSQTTISRMEAGRLPIALDYATWLAAQVIERKQYKRIQNMPASVLAQCIRKRQEL